MRNRVLTVALAMVASSAITATAASVAELRCEGGKNDAAGKYAACAARAQRLFVLTADSAKYASVLGKCEARLVATWNKLEALAAAAGATCPSTEDQSPIQDFVGACVQVIASAVGGDPLGADPVTCNAQLDACNAQIEPCADDLATCNGSLTSCTNNLSATNADLGTCTGSLGTCTGLLGDCNADLTTCGGNLASCDGSLTTCNGDLGTCNTSLTTCGAGTAVAADVLVGKTFSSSAGVGVTGTMTDNGAVSVTPGASAQPIAAGYHNGSGSVAGDADLAASNIVSGVSIFGVTGVALSAQPLKTGQTTSFGTGSDGNVQQGVARLLSDNGDGTVTDNRTGLMWEKKSDDGSIHDKNNTYIWGMAVDPYTMNGTMVTEFLANLNNTCADGTTDCTAGGDAACTGIGNGQCGFAGYRDWRVPNVNELHGLVDYGRSTPSVDPVLNSGCAGGCTVASCSCTQSTYYWSSSTSQAVPSNAWTVGFSGGMVYAYGKNSAYALRAVRAGS